MNTAKEKKELRSVYKQKRAEILNTERESISGRIAENIFSLDEYKKSDAVFTFIGTESEISTEKIISRAISDGKKVVVPVVTDKAHEMVFIEINSDTELTKSKMGILEPKNEREKQLLPTALSIVIVPALAVGKDFYRVGYGGGYYDKFLAENEYLAAAAVCCDIQIAESVPHDELDIKADIIVTEKEIYERK